MLQGISSSSGNSELEVLRPEPVGLFRRLGSELDTFHRRRNSPFLQPSGGIIRPELDAALRSVEGAQEDNEPRFLFRRAQTGGGMIRC